MDKRIAQKRIVQLTKEINYHADLYHQKDAPEISDEAYDSLYQELLSLEELFPDLRQHNSPTLRVGDKILEGFEKAQHNFPQWSFDNIFSWDELVEWEERVKRRVLEHTDLHHEPLEYVVELKVALPVGAVPVTRRSPLSTTCTSFGIISPSPPSLVCHCSTPSELNFTSAKLVTV